ncbi:MAG: hypothetical protein KAJ55_03305 [Anaerolineales bacterium]|nr:hypothetical protein [Anaerolineales bacterium]
MMRQAQIAEGKISKLRHTLAKLKDGEQEYLSVGDGMTPALTEVLLVDVADAMRELHRYVVMVEQECEQAKIQANRRRFF